MCRIRMRICIILIPIWIWISINMEILIRIPIAIKSMPVATVLTSLYETKIKLFQISYLGYFYIDYYFYWIGERDNLGGQQRVQVLSGQFLPT
jgi:hypothetical protein